MRRTFRGAAAISLAVLLLLTGCGAGASSSTAGGQTTGSASSGAHSSAQLRGILQCLRAAGFHHAYAERAMSGSPMAGPTGTSGPDAGGPIHFPVGTRVSHPKLVKALHLCRMTLPGFAPSS